MKKLTTFLLSMFTLLSVYSQTFIYDGYQYTAITANTVQLDGAIVDGVEHIQIPEKVMHGVKEYTVAAVRDSAFMHFDRLLSVELPHTVTRIGQFSFSNCKNLKLFEFPEQLIVIGVSAFESTNFTSVKLPNLVTTIRENAFANCKSLETVQLPPAIKSISAGLFSGCEKLETWNLFAENFK